MKNMIFRSAYRGLPQDQLNTFAGDVVKRLQTNPAYSTLQLQTQELADRSQQYNDLLVRARAGSKEDIVTKDQAKLRLLDQLDLLAFTLERAPGASEAYLVGAGFPLRSKVRQSYAGPTDAIVNLVAIATGKPGEVRCSFEHPLPKAVKVYAAEYSMDNGATWKNGTYHDKRSFVLTDLPNTREMWIRIRAIGRDSQLSAWSQPVVVAVP